MKAIAFLLTVTLSVDGFCAPGTVARAMPCALNPSLEVVSSNTTERCTRTADGLETELTGPDDVVMGISVLDFDGESHTIVRSDAHQISVFHEGWVCTYETDGRMIGTSRTMKDGNARYLRYEARGCRNLKVTAAVKPSIARDPVCRCGEAPERANDFFWENDHVGFRAYGPGDVHKWSGIDVFNKSCTTNIVFRWLRQNRDRRYGSWHKNHGLGMDDYAVGPGRGVGGVAFRRNGRWLPDYGNWVRYRILRCDDGACCFELDYRLPFGGTMTLRITLKRGTSFFTEEVLLSDDVVLEGLEFGVGLDLDPGREHAGDVLIDEANRRVALFEKPHDRPGEEGAMMSALCSLEPATTRLADGPNGEKLVMAAPGARTLKVSLGADWTEAGRFRTAEAWFATVNTRPCVR